MSKEYKVGEDGTIFKDGNVLKQSVGNGQGRYRKVYINGKHKLVHRLVAEKFLPNPEELPEVNHIDGNTLNNDVTNLEWCTKSQNMIHASGKPLKLERDGNIIFFDCISEAARFLESNPGNVSKAVNNVRSNIVKGWVVTYE